MRFLDLDNLQSGRMSAAFLQKLGPGLPTAVLVQSDCQLRALAVLAEGDAAPTLCFSFSPLAQVTSL